jgi:hypothetical protein
MSRLHPIRVYDLFLDARRRAKGNQAAAAQVLYDAAYDAGFAAGSAPRLVPAPAQPDRATVARLCATTVVDAVANRNLTSPEAVCATFPRFPKSPKADTTARDEAAWLLRHTGFRYTDIALALGLKCHTSAMDGVARMEEKIAEQPGLRDELLALVAGERRLKAVG